MYFIRKVYRRTKWVAAWKYSWTFWHADTRHQDGHTAHPSKQGKMQKNLGGFNTESQCWSPPKDLLLSRWRAVLWLLWKKKTDSQPENMQSQGGDKDPLGQRSFSIICQLTLGWLPLEPPDGKLLQTHPPRPPPRILMYTSGSKILYVQQDSQVILCSRQVWPIVKEIFRDIRCFSLER